MIQNERNLQLIKDNNFETLIKENERMVYDVLSKYNLYPLNEDIISVGTLGLFKAAKTFNNEYKIFSTYAYKCITNEIFIYLRNEKKQSRLNTKSFSDIAKHNYDGSELTLEDTLDSNIDIIFDIKKEEFYRIFKDALLLLSQKEKLCLLMYFAGYKQCEIAKKINYSQAHISRIIISAKSKVKQYLLDHDIDLHYFK